MVVFPRTRLADQGHHFSGPDLEADLLDDGQQAAVVLGGADFQPIDCKKRFHHTILFASLPPEWADMSSTIILIDMVSVAIARMPVPAVQWTPTAILKGFL